ncbi:MAG: hypothetical protein J7L46_06175 [Bacteroidales bacterium]|nr:hypothetical protein [Bacteroidales bacterium]
MILITQKNIVFFLIFFSVLFLYGQTTIPYSTDYKFKDGIYLQFSQFLSNKPLLKEHLIPYDKNDVFFLRNSLKKDTLSFINDNAIIQKIATKEIWGFAENNYCYIFYNGQFNRILTIGTIGFFVANITVSRTYFNDYSMMSYNDPFYYHGGNQTVENKELRRYLIDFTNGQVFPLDYRYFEQIISVDEKIFNEYSNLRKGKKRKLLFIYLRRFNEQHPLMLPK